MTAPRTDAASRDAALATRLEELILDLSRIRLRVETLGLSPSPALQDLSAHLTLASMAALRLRFRPGEDDIVVEDA
jgi:hypothetical protein